MSVVYLAEHLRLGRRVAFKVLAPHVAEDPGFRERFIRESRTAAGLDHPNIVTVYDAGEFDGLLYISMRFVEGTDLGHVLGESGAIEPWRTLTIVSQVGSALDAAHTEGLVHRDVKPGNILLSQPGTPLERAFLSDFGVTKRMTSAAALTRTGQFVGTVDYVAPEQIQGEPVDGRADVYSLGCVLYQCLSGHIPFPRPTDVATIYAHLHDETPVMPEGAYPGMDPVIARALAKDKDDRYPTCTALVEAARSNLHGNAATEIRAVPEAVVADTLEMPVPRRAPGRRTAWIVAAAVVTIVAVTTLAIALARRNSGTASSSQTSSSPPGSPSSSSGPPAIDPTHLHWNLESRSVFAHAVDQIAFTDAIQIPGPRVIAVGHADNPDEDAVVWTKVGNRWKPDYVAGHRPGSQKLEGIAWVDGRRLVAVGYDDSTAVGWYSDDHGHSWKPVTGLTGGIDAKTVVQANDGTIWALGRGAVWTSADGASWTTADASAFGPDDYAFSAIPYGTGAFAVGEADGPGGRDAAVWLLSDGSWMRVDQSLFDLPGEQYLHDVAADPLTHRLVAVGADLATNSAMAWTSAEATSWQQVSIPGRAYRGLGSVLFIAGSPDAFIAGGWNGRTSDNENAAIWFSRDGTNWTLQRGSDTYDLGDRGAQQIRALAPYEDQGIAVYAFGQQGSQLTGKPQLWRGSG
jgi:serine/threonine protein kinase